MNKRVVKIIAIIALVAFVLSNAAFVLMDLFS